MTNIITREKGKIAAAVAFIQMYMLSFLTAHADMNETVQDVWKNTFSNIKPMVKFIFWGSEAVIAAFIVGYGLKVYQEYKRTGDVNWGPLIVLFIVIGLLITLSANDCALLWSIVGLS